MSMRWVTPEGPRLGSPEEYKPQPDFVTQAFKGGSNFAEEEDNGVTEDLKAAQAKEQLVKSLKDAPAATQADAVQTTTAADLVEVRNAADVVKEDKRVRK